ncbi:phosphatase domain-containing protein [Sphingobium chungbukense]|uniref:Polynucleotide kinase PNKP phosphatase domain-containing protein n=1 Tax=Sphingobium chungbukense TaxID=56193 RepID=A0A0M3AZB1_9SPHN|nr:hypothetical protein [Sphingobium chungbukense]KKW93894.1 hypothetical protein YP76_04390 [Sphingobium chungbukense]
MFVVFDLDGTLANCEHRLHHIAMPAHGEADWPEQNWDAFYATVHEDTPISPVQACAAALIDTGHRVEIWTGRSDNCRVATQRWLNDHGLGGLPLIMREGGDRTADYRLKRGWITERGKPDLIFEDRASVVAMWREQGIICAQVAPGDF